MARRKFYKITERGIDQLRLIEAMIQAPALPKSEDDDMQSGERYQVFQSFTMGGQRLPRGHWLDDQQIEMLRGGVNWPAIRESFLRVGVPPKGWKPMKL